VANTLKLFRRGAVGFIVWLDLSCATSLVYKQTQAAKNASEECKNATHAQLEEIGIGVNLPAKRSKSSNKWMALVEADRVLLNAARPNCADNPDGEKDHCGHRSHRIAMNVFDKAHEV
jgi:hypothetical protein